MFTTQLVRIYEDDQRLGSQRQSNNSTALDGVTLGADQTIYADGSGNFLPTDITAAARAFLAAISAAAERTVLGLGSAALLAGDTDITLAANSDANVATQKAVKTYVDNTVTGVLKFKGSTDCSANPNYAAAAKGDAYLVTVAGKIGGASGVAVDIGDVYAASAANAGGTQAAVGTSWFVLEHNLVGALLSANNLSDLASAATARTNLGLGSMATQAASAVAITGGTVAGLTSFAIRNAGTGAFDMTVAHNGTLTAGRTLTWNLNDAARTVSLSGNLTVSSAATISNTNTGDQTITLTGDATGTGTGSFAVTVGKVNGVAFSGLATGILKNTTTTGVPSIAVAADFPTLNQNTTGTAAGLSATLAVASGGTNYTGVALTTFTPTITANSGTFTTTSATIHYLDIGKIRFFSFELTITALGSAAGAVITTTPSGTAKADCSPGSGYGKLISGKQIKAQMVAGASTMSITNYDNTFPAASGEKLVLTGWYELA